MTSFVLDNSVAMRWHLETNKKSDQKYALDVLVSMEDNDALVPNLWHLEVANVLLSAVKCNDTSEGEAEAFISQLDNLPIHVDPITAHQVFSRTLNFARSYNLSSYDAAYFELAVREGLPLATLDKQLIKALKSIGIDRYRSVFKVKQVERKS